MKILLIGHYTFLTGYPIIITEGELSEHHRLAEHRCVAVTYYADFR